VVLLALKLAVCPVIEPVAVRFPVMLWFPVKLLLAESCGTLVVSRFKVRLPPVPPPVRSVPAVTPVTTLVVSTFRVTFPLVPPPVRSVPAVTPEIVPVPGNVWPVANVICPSLAMFNPVSDTLFVP
jgi:hypothetical protein